jgi:hypothetical protein
MLTIEPWKTKNGGQLRFNLAAAQGHERARDARDSVLTSLSPDQVLAAQRAAQEWQPFNSAH